MSSSSLLTGTPAVIPTLATNNIPNGTFTVSRSGTAPATAPANSNATLRLDPRGPNGTYWDVYATGTAGGGLTQDQLSLWGYSSGLLPASRNIQQYLTTSANSANSLYGQGANGMVSLNPVFLDSTRVGTVPAGAGGATVVNVNTIVASSRVLLIPIAISAAAAAAGVVPPAAPVIAPTAVAGTAGTFTFNAQAGVGYLYIVV